MLTEQETETVPKEHVAEPLYANYEAGWGPGPINTIWIVDASEGRPINIESIALPNRASSSVLRRHRIMQGQQPCVPLN